MIPVRLVPTIWTLYGMQFEETKRMGMVSMKDFSSTRSEGVEIRGPKQYFALAHATVIEADTVGILLLGLAFSLILLALNLSPAVNGGWSNLSMIAVLVVGVVILVVFVAYEAFVATVPITPK
jgi:hypothetical protein